jgi:flagellar basal body-associated protein FliL
MMKKAILVICISLALTISGLIPAAGQEQPKPEKDTVNMDTNAKPEFYYSTEDENSETNGSGKSSAGTIAIIAGAVIVVGAVAFFLLKKKK